MIIAGAGGHGLEVRHALVQQGIATSEIYFFDSDVTKLLRRELLATGISDIIDIQKHFSKNPRFILGVGNPILREKLFHQLTSLGGIIYGIDCVSSSTINNSTAIFDAMPYSFIGPETKIGLGVLVNTRAHIHHECVIGDFSEVGPGAILLGASKVGSKCRIGAGAVLLPGVELGDEVIVGAGAVVVKSFPNPCTLIGIPASAQNL